MSDVKRWIFCRAAMQYIFFHRFRIFFFSIFSIVIVLSPVAAQRNVLRIDGNVKEEKEKLEGVSVTVYKNQQFFAKTVTASNGRFRFQLDYDADYLLEFSKPGFVTKRVSVDTDSVPYEDQDFGHEYGGWDLSLFRMVEGLDVSMFEKPFVKIAYNPDLNKFEHDVEYTSLVKEEFAELQKELEKKKKEEEKQKKEEAKAAGKAAAEAIAKQKAEEEAKRKAALEEEARKKKEKEAEIAAQKKEERKKEMAKAQMAEEEIKKAEKESARQKAENDETAKLLRKNEEPYQQLISQADTYFKKQEYDNAKKYYLSAQNIRPKESYPQQKIQEINAMLNNASISANKARRDTGQYKTKEEFLQALAKLYPQGMTEEVYMEGNVKVTRRIVVDGNLGTEYKFTEHPWGGRFWFKNGTSVNESVWNMETQVKK